MNPAINQLLDQVDEIVAHLADLDEVELSWTIRGVVDGFQGFPVEVNMPGGGYNKPYRAGYACGKATR